MKKTKRKAANRRLKRLLSRYRQARALHLIPTYTRDVRYTSREVIF